MNKVECKNFIQHFFEDYYKKQEEIGDVTRPKPAPEMWSEGSNPEEEWKKWKLMPTTTTEEEIEALEAQIGVKLPECMRIFFTTCFHYFDAPVGEHSIDKPFEGIKNAWNPWLVKSGHLPFTWDEDRYFIRCMKLDQLPNEEECGIFQIDHEILCDIGGYEEEIYGDEEAEAEDMAEMKAEIDACMEKISTNLFTYLEGILKEE